MFMPMDVQTIMGIPLCTRSIPDFWAWHYDRRGVFSVRSAYRMITAIKAPIFKKPESVSEAEGHSLEQ